MAGSFVELALEVGDDRMQRGMADLRRAVTDLRPFLRDVGEYLDLATRFRFDTATAPDGSVWEALDPEYAVQKPRRKDQILVLEGHLRDQMRYQVHSDELVFGTNLVYGATHQFGDPARGIPARPYLGLSTDDEAHVLSLALEHLEDAA